MVGSRGAVRVEDCRHVSTRLERALLEAGQAVCGAAEADGRGSLVGPDQRHVGPGRRVGDHAGRVAGRATRDSVSREVKPLVDHRAELVATADP
jgi:transposase